MSTISNILADHNSKNINVIGNFINKNIIADFTDVLNYNISNVSGQYIICKNFNSTFPHTITLPPITSDMVGYSFYLVSGDTTFNLNLNSNPLTLVSIGSDLINGVNNTDGFVIYGSAEAQYGWGATVFIIQIYCDGTQWICSIANAGA